MRRSHLFFANLQVDLFSSSFFFSLFHLSFSFAFPPFFYPFLHVRIKALRQSQPRSQGSLPGRREPWERGCASLTFFIFSDLQISKH